MAAVLLNWRAPEMTLKAVLQLLQQTTVPDHIFVVENGSNDNSGQFLVDGLQLYEERVTVLINERNLGFGGGCNTALREILSHHSFDWVWLVNNDATPAPDCLTALLGSSTPGDERPGLIGTLMIDPSAPDQAHYGCWMHPSSLVTHGVHRDSDLDHPLSWLTAASLLVSTDALRVAGLFDEHFFMYWEDADLNVRIREAGFRITLAPDAHAHHVAGTSSRGIETQRYLWHFASQTRFLEKHHTAPRTAKVWLRLKYLLKAVLDRDLARFAALMRA